MWDPNPDEENSFSRLASCSTLYHTMMSGTLYSIYSIHTHSSDTHAGEVGETDENVPIKNYGKTPPKLLRFLKKTNGYRPNMYMVSERRHGWRRSCCFLFLSSEKWGQKSERQIRYCLLSSRNVASKLTLRLMGQLLDFLSLLGF